MYFKTTLNRFINKTFPCPVGNQWSFINNNLHTQNIHRSSKGSSSLDRLYSRKIRKQLVHHKQVILMPFYFNVWEHCFRGCRGETCHQILGVAFKELHRLFNILRLNFLICKTATIVVYRFLMMSFKLTASSRLCSCRSEWARHCSLPSQRASLCPFSIQSVFHAASREFSLNRSLNIFLLL